MSVLGERDAVAQAEALLELKRPKDAIDVLRHAAAENPDDPKPRCLLANALLDVGEIDEAREAAQAAIATAPDDEWAHRLLALSLLLLKRTKKALAVADRAVALAPDHADAHMVRSQVLLNMRRRNKDAEAAARRALELAPEVADCHALLGGILLEAGREREAVEAYRRALALDPEDAASHNDLGVAYLQLGKEVYATECFERAAQLDPRFDTSRRNLIATAHSATATGLPLGLLVVGTYQLMRHLESPLLGLAIGLTAWWIVTGLVLYVMHRSEEDDLPARTRALVEDERRRKRRRPWTMRPRLFRMPLTLRILYAIPRPLRVALGVAALVAMLLNSNGYTASDWTVVGFVAGLTALLAMRVR